jgi:hypothetical protein
MTAACFVSTGLLGCFCCFNLPASLPACPTACLLASLSSQSVPLALPPPSSRSHELSKEGQQACHQGD